MAISKCIDFTAIIFSEHNLFHQGHLKKHPEIASKIIELKITKKFTYNCSRFNQYYERQYTVFYYCNLYESGVEHIGEVPGAETGQEAHHLLPLLGVIKQPPLSPGNSGLTNELLLAQPHLAGTRPALSHSPLQMFPGEVIRTLSPLSWTVEPSVMCHVSCHVS